MCGILGYIAYEKERLNFDDFKKSLILCSSRGTDATGIFAPNVGIVKKDLEAEKFVEEYSEQIKESLKSNVLIAHCRATTKGTEKNNVNNHPHESERYILIHNGSISRTDKINDYKYLSDCDSEIILSYVEKYGIEKGLGEMYSSDAMAIALYDKKDKFLYLFRNVNPTSVLVHHNKSMILFASEDRILKPFYPTKKSFGFTLYDNINIFDSKKEHLYKFDLKNGLVNNLIEIKQKQYYYREDKHRHQERNYSYTNYQNNSEFQKEWCNACESMHYSNARCQTKISRNMKSSVKREIIYRGGYPKYIIHDPNEYEEVYSY